MAKDNKYAKVEGLLYSYSTLQNRITNMEIDMKLEKDTDKVGLIKAEKDKLYLNKCKIDNMLDALTEDERELIELRYIKGLDWDVIDAKLNKLSVRQLIRKRNGIINNKLISFIDYI